MKPIFLLIAQLAFAGCQTAPVPEFRPATATESPAPRGWNDSFRRVETFVRQGESTPGDDYLYYRTPSGDYVKSVWLIGVRY